MPFLAQIWYYTDKTVRRETHNEKVKNETGSSKKTGNSGSLRAALPNDYDETFLNGCFHFNIEQLLIHMAEHKNEFVQVSVAVSDWRDGDGFDDGFIELADLTRPIILAEIAPDRLEYYPNIVSLDWRVRGYSLIDGHHRIEKAYRHGIKQLPAYLLPMEHHVGFIFKGYQEYADYWNGKLLDYENDMKRRQCITEMA